ncbi:histone-lysine N-methyltransferase trithorax [Chironomus tepperi]|uniref:histone-lysine N-methyltransferase trithorax n=1 Tax=Chironomus tepperi TaxID=113505 RepID=UPI00391F192E
MFNKTKFPGKPSKLVNKKRVSVLSYDNNCDKRVNDHCEIDCEKNLASPKHEHGYQTESATTTKQSTEESEEKSKPVMTTEQTENQDLTSTKDMDNTEKIKNDLNCDKLDKKTKNLKKHVTFRQTIETSDQCKVKRVYNPNFNGPIVSIIKKESLKYPILVYKTNCIVRPSKLTEIVKKSDNNIDKLNSLKFGRDHHGNHQLSTSPQSQQGADCGKSSNVIVASKFNLPKLSVNSSRVIKPNKRFLFDTGEDASLSKKKVIKPSPWGEGGNPVSSSSLLKDKKNFGFNFVDELELKSTKPKEPSKLSPSTLTIPALSALSTDNKLSNNLSTSILRKPVLQLSTNFSIFGSQESDSNLIKSPFSLKLHSPNSTSNLSSTIFTKSLVCVVCNSITTRKQPRKYGAICCELCKKFMSKMIERVNKHTVQNWQCDKGDGCCTIEPVPTKTLKASKVESNLKALSKGRCYACWLKKCLNSFQLPSPLKARLTNVLPKNIMEPLKPVVLSNNDNSNIFLNSIKSFSSFKLSSNPLAINNFTFGSKPDIKSNVDNVLKNAFASDKPLLVDIPKETTPVAAVLSANSETKKSPRSPKGSPKISQKTTETVTTAPVQEEQQPSPSTSASILQNQVLNPANVSVSDSLRQKRLLLKGPRVKHVCRSASLVLGLPIAVFPGGPESQDGIENPEEQAILEDPTLDENSEKENLAFVVDPLNDDKSNTKDDIEIDSTDSKVDTKNEIDDNKINLRSDASIDDIQSIKKIDILDICKPITRKLTRPNLSLSQTQNFNRISSKSIPSSKRLLFNHHNMKTSNSPPMISIDFWENYDPAEVSRTGFGLILSEKTPIKSVCFLCGSYGKDPLIFCVCCCEPYHFYCVEDEFNVRFKTNDFLNTSSMLVNETTDSLNMTSESVALVDHNGYDMPLNKKLNWLCPRCTVCYTCNMSTGVKVKCWKCEKNFHTTCLGTSKRLLCADRPLICATCLKCKSCGTTNVTKFIGNLAMCSNCFRLRRKGNYCPLCQKCYENNDYDVKMMECGDCKRWVHAKCEGITDEQYNLLSVLPEHIEFICKKCCPNNPSSNIWRESVEAEFKTSLLSVIKLLSKSRHACALLRMSPRKKNPNCFCGASKGNFRRHSNSIEPTNFNLLFDALKTDDCVEPPIDNHVQCNCFGNNDNNNIHSDPLKPSINLTKQNIHDNKYHSLQAFNYDMNKILNDAQSDDLVIAYNEIISEIFPWYQNETKACTDALEETMNDHSKSDLLDDLMLETENSDYFIMTNFNVPENLIKNEVENMQSIFFNEKDARSCMLCKKEGECSSDEEGRLLYCGHNTWIHTNCALWSAEVYEEIDGSLQNVHSAISRGRLIKCSKCGIKGATVGCNYKNCGEQYHFQCAKSVCDFRIDKSVFCPQHISKTDDDKQSEKNFQVNRSVYVELDRRKKKTVEATKVQFLIGSLCVTKLGRIIPILSDAGDYLIPVDFECTRLFWSSKQPWNIVEYKIKVSIQRSNYHSLIMDKGINFTVDHTKSLQSIQKNLKQIALFHNSISKDQDTMIQEETQDEEPQNSTNDLLPPEIKAAIFEDLPHDVFDGISMFDIFPKDPSDVKTPFFNHVSDEDDENSKSNHINGDGDVDSDLNGLLNSIQSEFSSEYSFVKRDDPEPKKRKLSATDSNDSNNNPGIRNQDQKASSMISVQKYINQQNDLRNIKSKDFIDKIPQLDGLNDEILMQSDGPVACEKCRCTYRNRTSYERHLATCEIIQNTSESDSEAQDGNHVYIANATSQHQTIAGLGGGNVISMINQQQNQSMATSIPIVINNPLTTQNGIIHNGVQIPNLQNLQLALSNDGNLCQNVIVDQQGQQIYTQPLQLGQFGQTATLMPIRNFNNQANVINNGGIQYINSSQQQQPTQYIQLAHGNGGNTQQIMTITSQNSSDQEHKSQKKPLLLPSPVKGKSKTVTNAQIVKANSITNKKKLDGKSQQQISVMNSKNVQIANFQSSRSNASQSQTTIAQPSAQNIIFQQPAQQMAPQISQYPLILNQNGQFVQYISADNTQNNAPIQYISQIGSNGKEIKNGSQNFITSAQPTSNVANQQIFQNSFQLPSNNTGNLVLTPNGLSVLPVVQQSPIMGTLIQQPQALQCVNGVVSAEQMMLGSTPTAIEMDPSSGCMYLTSQPVYYGLETIVQNTVMSSQQFVSTAMQGICQNSSFSATTTQVFQASKIEPIQMEIPAGYVLLNASDGTIHQPQIMDSSWNSMDDKKQSLDVGAAYGNQKSQNIILKPSNQKTKVQSKVNKIQPQIVSKIVPTTSTSSMNVTSTNSTTTTTTVLKTVNTDSPPKIQQQHHQQQSQQSIQLINHNATIAKKQKATYRTIGPKTPQEEIVKISTSAALIKPKLKVQAKPIQQNISNNYQSVTVKSNTSAHIQSEPHVVMETEIMDKNTIDQPFRTVQNNIITTTNNNNNLKTKIENPSTSTAQASVINVPTNVVNPLQTQNSIFNNLSSKNQNSSVKPNFQNRPTNRVLPMPASVTSLKSASNITSSTKSGNIVKGNNQNKNLSSGNIGTNNMTSIRNSSPSIVDNHSVVSSSNNNNNSNIILQNDNENYCEKIKSIAMELQSSNKADELFDALRRSTINNVITITPGDQHMDKMDKKMKISTPPRPNIESYPIPSTSASSIIDQQKCIVTKTSSVCSLTKTIDSVATGANLLDDEPQMSVTPIELMPPSITIIPIDPIDTIEQIDVPMEKSLPEVIEEEEEEKVNLESMFEVLPELKAPKDAMSTSDEIISTEDDSEELKIHEKTPFPAYDEETTSDRPSTSSACSTYATKASREKTPTSTTNSKSSGPKLLFEIQSQDGFTYKSTSISEIWEKLFETVQLARKAHGLMPLPEGRLNEMTGDQMLGLKTNALKYLLEQLPGVEKCTKYSPKYHRRNSSASSTSSTSSFSSMNGNCSSMSGFYGSSSFSSNASNLSSNSSVSLMSLSQYINDADEILYENIYGCARFEPFSTRSEYDMFSWLASRHRLPPMPVHLQSNNDEVILRRGTGSNLPMAMKYRTLKETYKKNVGVYRSHIHGRGLFCTRDIEAGEMVIEYAGELIRSTLTDKRERYYDSKGIGCYMFKIDENLVVDATMSGTAARFINHSCDPNCYSKVVDILGQKHIIIFALRRIVTGEELTYDYKFDIEDNKIPCCCGAKRCRKYMN